MVLSESIYHEIRFLVHSYLLGMVITFAYDNFRVFRRVIKHNTFFVSLEDFVFWIGVSISIFLLQHRENAGVFRWFSVAGAFLGMVFYRVTLSRFYVKKMTFVLKKVLNLLYIFFSYLFSPIYFLERKAGNMVKKIANRARQTALKQKIRLTSKRKMIKMTLCKQRKQKTRSEGRAHEQEYHSS